MKALAMTLFMVAMMFAPQAQGGAPDHWGQRLDTSFAELAEGYADPNMRYAPFMFWFWDEPLNSEKMVKMAEKMISQGINPGYAHPRRSMNDKPGLPDKQWLGAEWFEAFNAVTATAKAQDAYLGYVDEYWWPSLRAHGRVLEANPELEACSLATDTIDLKGGTSSAIPACSFAVAASLADKGELESGTLRLITEGEPLVWRAPPGANWRVYVFTEQTRRDVNCMDPRLGPAFIEIAIQPYEEHCGDELGQTILGDFVDTEGGYGSKLVWSDGLRARYEKQFGRDIRVWLPLMLDRDREGLYRKARWEWFDLVSDIYVENFKTVVDWHEERGMYCIANFWEESLPAQALRVGDHMKMQRAYTMPGQDALHDGVLYVHDFKEAVSVAEFENRRVFSEMLGASQWYRFHPTLLKKALNSVTTWGISHMAPHGVFTNRDLTGNIWPPDWYTENPLFEYLHLWADFSRRASFINSHGRQEAKVLLYTPLESVWTLTGGFHFDSREPGIVHPWSFPETDPGAKRANMMDRAYAKAMNDLVKGRIEHLAVDRHYLKAMTLDEGLLRHGAFAFETLVLPPLDILETEVARKILAFAQQGGNVYCLGDLPAASVEHGSNDPAMVGLMEGLRRQPTCFPCPSEPLDVRAEFKNHWMGWEYESETDGYGLMPLIEAEAPGLRSPIRFLNRAFAMLQQHRVIDDAHFFWLANNTAEPQTPTIGTKGITGNVTLWRCETGERTAVPASVIDSDGLAIDLVFEPLEAYWLVVDPKKRGMGEKPVTRREAVETVEVTGPWVVHYREEGQPDLERVWEIPKSLTGARGRETALVEWSKFPDLDERFTGFLDYHATFDATLGADGVWLDLGQVHDMAEVWVNGKHVSKKLWPPYRFDITGALTAGENTLRVRVGNLVNNYYGQQVPSGLLGPVTIVAETTRARMR